MLEVCGRVGVVRELEHGVDRVLTDRVRWLGVKGLLIIGCIGHREVAAAWSLGGGRGCKLELCKTPV